MSSPEPLSSTTDPAFAVDPTGVIVGWNRAAEGALGYGAAQALGKPCCEVLKGRDEFGNLYCVPGCPLLTMARRHQPVSRCRLFFETAEKRAVEFHVTSLVFPYGGGSGERLVHVLTPPVHGTETATTAPGLSPNQARGALTGRELEVLALLAKGRETAEVAELLCISQTTTANHIQHILHKLRVHSRLQAVVLGRQLDLI